MTWLDSSDFLKKTPGENDFTDCSEGSVLRGSVMIQDWISASSVGDTVRSDGKTVRSDTQTEPYGHGESFSNKE